MPLFRGMSDKALARVAEISKEVSHRAGKTILEEDHSAVGFHLILSGEADATQGGAVVSTMGPGDYFGEMSLIDGKPRSASVVAKTELRTLAIPAWNFNRLLDENPDMSVGVARVVVRAHPPHARPGLRGPGTPRH